MFTYFGLIVKVYGCKKYSYETHIHTQHIAAK